jgi:glycine/D-amino acid oxidase-like deaminating enzyme
MSEPRVAVIGAGFGGLAAALRLALGSEVKLTALRHEIRRLETSYV